MKKLLFIFSFVLVLFTSCESQKKSAPSLLSLVPSKTALILETNNLEDLKKQFQQNNLFNQNSSLPLSSYLKEKYDIFNKVAATDQSFILFNIIGRDQIALTLMSPTAIKTTDSLDYKQTDHFTYNGAAVNEFEIDSEKYYSTRLNGLYVFGNSKLVVENIIRIHNDKIEPSKNLDKVYKSSSHKDQVVYINYPEFAQLTQILFPKSQLKNTADFTNWIALDLKTGSKNIQFSGTTVPEKSEILGILSGQEPQKTSIENVTPIGAESLYSFTYHDLDQLKDNIAFYRKTEYPSIDTDFLEDFSEIGIIRIGESKAIAAKASGIDSNSPWVAQQGSPIKIHRAHRIDAFSQPNYFYQSLAPLINLQNVKYFSKVDSYYIFAQDLAVLENIISNYENGTVLAKSEAFKKMAEKLDQKSSILEIGINRNLIKTISNHVDDKYKEAYEKIKLNGFEISALQFINHDNFSYINAQLMAAGESKNTSTLGGVQTRSFKPGEPVANGPWFFENWRTHHFDVALQGKSNTLYVFDENGKQRWNKQLDGPIIGDILPIDIYQNKRIQMAFVTPQTFYIIDREGNVVKPYQKTFKQSITQPLSIFDYNHDGTFRFLIVQNKSLKMLDKELKTVKGFEFTTAKSNLTHSPKHYRIGNKDYILLTEESGKLHILNPRGQTRIKTADRYQLSSNEWYVYNGLFTSTTRDGQLLQIDQQGGINKQNLKLGTDHKIDATAKTLVTFSENKLTIKGKAIKMDYGLYSSPKIFYLQNKIYISITDTQAHKVFLFDSNGELLSGFPVYGNSAIDLQYFQNDGVKLIVKGEGDTVIMYDVR